MITILQVDGSSRLAKMCGAYPNEPAALARIIIREKLATTEDTEAPSNEALPPCPPCPPWWRVYGRMK
jgi:hypothetical protein